MLGLEPATTGKVNFLGLDFASGISEDDIAQFRKENVGIVYQQTNWIKALTVKENVAFAASLLGLGKEESYDKALEMLDLVGMKGWADFFPSELSSGQQQKVALARALITDPQVIVADEPGGNLDYQSGLELMNLMRALQTQGKTIIMVTHNPDNLDYATSIVRVFDGHVLEVINTAGRDIKQIRAELLEAPSPDLLKQTKSLSLGDIKMIANEKKGTGISFGALIPRLSFLSSWKWIPETVFFLIVVIYYLIANILESLFSSRIMRFIVRPSIRKFFGNLGHNMKRLLHRGQLANTISRFDIIDLSIKNLLVKRTRSIVTIGGMALGVGFIVFLVSVGYGLENLVVSRVGSLKERLQLDVLPIVSSNVNITDQTLSTFSKIDGASKVLPFVSVAGKVNINNSNTDVVVYGVQKDYLSETSVKLAKGNYFDSNELTLPTDSSTGKPPVANDSNDSDKQVTIDFTDNSSTPTTNKPISLPDTGVRTALVNLAFLQLSNIDAASALNQTFTLAYTVTGNLVEGGEKVESLPVEYKIVGVVDDALNPVVYVPVIDVRQLGVTRYSQVKIIASSEKAVPELRNKIDFLGFRTSSVLDTVNQIEQLFANVRIFLGIFGVIALAVAALGMFNTVTVSLLERTREVGLMKAIGMKSSEVRDLFLTESMIMGLMGGVLGIVVGYLFGKLLSLGLSAFALAKGGDSFIDVSLVPIGFMLFVILIAILIGLFTGIFPARRATQISALNALRYE